jgi:hypothetical protein
VGGDGGWLRIPGFAPGFFRRRLGPIFTMPKLADPLAEPVTQALVLINPMAAGVADLQGAREINLEHGGKSGPFDKFFRPIIAC